MKAKIKFAIALSLGLILIFSSTCKRTAIEEPSSPIGPSSISITLKVSSSKNVLQAGETRGESIITATLKKYDGIALGNKTVYFEILDLIGVKTDVGYFEGDVTTKEVTTDGNGVARATYYGPLSDEVNGSTTIYISAKVSWEGRQFFSELSPIKIIGDTVDKIIYLYAKRTILYAGSERELTMVKATLETIGGVPLANKSLRFDILDENDDPAYLGYFRGKKQVEIKQTDQDGKTYVDYFGPLSGEITADTTVYIHATLIGEEGVNTRTPIHIVKDGTDLILNISADPSIITAGSERETSAVTATFKADDGTPLANETLIFDLVNSSGTAIYTGFLDNNENIVAKDTDATGTARVTYSGPLETEISADTTVYIRATVDRLGQEFTAMTPIIIELEQMENETLLGISADPNAITAGTTRETSQVTANLESLDGTPIVDQIIVFDIVNSSGTSIYTGYFGNQKTQVSKATNSNGDAKVTYHGPLNTEITADTTVYIRATVNWTESTSSTTMTPIAVTLEEADVILNISANPATLDAGTTRETSAITATLETTEADPIAGETMIFDIVNSSGTTIYVGYFNDNKTEVSEDSDANGEAQVTYYGPLDSEISADTTVYIRVKVTYEGTEFTVMTPIVIDDEGETVDVLLNISANPTVLDAGLTRETSTITATLETTEGDPIAGETMIFDIVNSSGTTIYAGYFTGNKTEVSADSDANGQAQVTYYGPLSSEISASLTVYIRVKVTYQGTEFTVMTPIVVTKI